MKKVAVIGAGISGLTCANLLKDRCEVHVFEKEKSPGGLIRCERLDEGLFHVCGGHVFNTKDEQVFKWFWNRFDRDLDFVKAKRNSAIAFDDGRFVGYPIENHVYQLPDAIWQSFFADLEQIESGAGFEPTNFADFLRMRFGETLYELYFKPYNAKVWRCDLSEVPLEWLSGKLPMPTVEEMRRANQEKIEETSFVHSSFWYEKHGGSQFIADTLAKGLPVRYETDVSCIRVKHDGGIEVDGEHFDRVVFCGNVKFLPQLLEGVDLRGVTKELDALQSHGTTAVFCEIDRNPYSWVYQPSGRHDSHRIICTGNFAPSNNAKGHMTATVEFTDEVSDDAVRRQLARMPFHPRFIKSHFSEYSYPIQTALTRDLVSHLKTLLSRFGISLVGRFAEWEYFNMDAAMASAMQGVNGIL